MDTLAADREYAISRLVEARAIREDASRVCAEIERALGEPGDPPVVQAMRWAEFCEQRRWQLRHIGIELDIIAFRPPPLWLWLPIWVQPPAWYEQTPWRTLAALWRHVRARGWGFG